MTQPTNEPTETFMDVGSADKVLLLFIGCLIIKCYGFIVLSNVKSNNCGEKYDKEID